MALALAHIKPFAIPLPDRAIQRDIQVLGLHIIPKKQICTLGYFGSPSTSFLFEAKEMAEKIEMGKDS